jgi:YHS domain-containing protein
MSIVGLRMQRQLCTMKQKTIRFAGFGAALRKLLSAAFLVWVVTISFGQSTSVSETHLNVKDGIALKGYDPVAYFTEGKPVKGEPSFSYQWKGVQWFFANKKNQDAFSANPEKYAPQYGGYCAYGASRGYKADTDPQAFTIVGEKLFLNYNLKVKEEWLKDTARRIQLANDYWKTL